jgi:Zn-dependent protease
MELLRTTCLGRPLLLEATMAGWQRVFWGGTLVSERVAGHPSEGIFEHRFELPGATQPVPVMLRFELVWEPFGFRYDLVVGEQVAEQGQRQQADLEKTTPSIELETERKIGAMGLIGLLLKIAKSAKVIKGALAAGTLAAYSWLFSLPFALCLIACLVVHEYGHLRAMRYFGMKTKGIYLIPFLGGLAVTEDRINTRWQNVVISLMGPVYGTALSLLSLVAWLVTDNLFFAALASFNALLNLFNLLPILPLDGGHVLKSVTFSMGSRTGVVLCGVGALFGVGLSYLFGLTLLGFLLLLGSIEIIAEWRMRHLSHLLPMASRTCTFATVWYVGTVLTLVGIIAWCGSSGDQLLGVPLLILKS